jgi:alpha-tubulin suppressor-like RCC1 family protein
LGHKNRTDVKSPKQVDFDKKISVVSCGNGHTALITEKGELYMFGRGKEGQLGREEENESSAGYRTTPKHVEAFKNKRVVNVKCGGEHTMALVEE